jgi:hypothetical protein
MKKIDNEPENYELPNYGCLVWMVIGIVIGLATWCFY